MTFSPDRVLVSLHEAGHAVAALVVGLGLDSATIVPDGDWAGHVVVPVPDDRDLAYWVARSVMTWAGPLAEQRHIGAVVGDLGGDDRQQIVAYAAAVAIGPREAAPFAAWTRERAMTVLNEHFEAVAEVAAALRDYDTLTGDEVRQIVDEVEDGPTVVPVRRGVPLLAVAAGTTREYVRPRVAWCRRWPTTGRSPK